MMKLNTNEGRSAVGLGISLVDFDHRPESGLLHQSHSRAYSEHVPKMECIRSRRTWQRRPRCITTRANQFPQSSDRLNGSLRLESSTNSREVASTKRLMSREDIMIESMMDLVRVLTLL